VEERNKIERVTLSGVNFEQFEKVADYLASFEHSINNSCNAIYDEFWHSYQSNSHESDIVICGNFLPVFIVACLGEKVASHVRSTRQANSIQRCSRDCSLKPFCSLDYPSTRRG
jgi:hypothetical protein